jgi:hypothetical protein
MVAAEVVLGLLVAHRLLILHIHLALVAQE